MDRPHWVLDTNVIISAALSPAGNCAGLLRLATDGKFTPAWDNRVLLEYRDVLQRPKFQISGSVVENLLGSFPAFGFYQTGNQTFGLLDVDDEVFLNVALATQDKTIVTGNRKHFPAKILEPLGVDVLSPREALDRLR
jgi:putative PIN family toxin of toxin-antitoxin system